MSQPNVVVLGSGMAGLGAAHRLHAEGITPVMYDKNSYPGGHTASFRSDSGFTFDLGPHISYTKDPRIQDLLADSVDQRYETLKVNLNNYWRGYWPKHPVQQHLHGLPEETIVKVIADFVAEAHAPERTIKNYEDWLLASFGRAFAEEFPMRYARKYHTTTASNLSTEWLGPRFYRPSLEEVLRGALSPAAPTVHYITNFRYPSDGGFVRYLTKFIPKGRLNLNHELIAIDPRARRLVFANGEAATYDALVSSVPLPELIPMIAGVPADVVEAAGRLACTTCVLVNIGVNREDLSSAQMTYFYDEDICFSRIGYPHMLTSKNAPPGTGSIQAEVYFSKKYRPLSGTPADWIEPVIADLRRCGILRDDDQVLFKEAMLLKYANIIFDLERASALATVHGFLDDIGVSCGGRYGEWGYLWTDEAFKSGENAAQKALERVASSARA
jgi:protoporphyrinogen oxidase